MAGEYVLSVLLKATNQAGGAISSFMQNIDAAHSSVLGLAVGGAAAIVGFGAASAQMAADYQQSMLKVQALTGSSDQQIKQYDTGLKQLSTSAGVAPKALADGLYNVISAGYQGADAMKVLTLATQDSKIGMTDASVTSDALTNVMASFGAKVSDATRINGEMLETVTLGKSTFEQYATSIVKSASSASQFHVSMETMNAAFATMTSSGIRAAQASTDFQQSLKVMYGNVGTVAKSLHASGIAFDENAFNAMDYGHKVTYLNAALQEANNKHVKVTGVTLQASQAISTISQHIKTYNDNLKTLSDKNAMAKKTQEAWATTQQGFNQQMSRVQASMQVLMITIGQALLPAISKIVGAIAPVITSFTQWLSKGENMQTFLTILGGAFAGFAVIILAIVVPAMWAWATATIAATWPILLIGAIVAVVVVGIILAIRNWGAISKWLQNAWNTTIHAIGNFFSWLGTHVHQILSAIGSAIGGFFSALGTKVHQGLDAVVNFFKAAWAWVLNAAKIAFTVLLLIIIGPIGDLIVLIVTHWKQIQSFISTTWTNIQNIARAAWFAFLALATQFIVNIILKFLQLKADVTNHVQALITTVRTFFTNLPAQALQWGENLITGFINGIRSKLDAVGNAASSVVNTVKNFLGFHSPAKQGPGSDADTWAPNLMKMYVKGIQGGMAGIKVAVKNAAALMKAGFTEDADLLNQKINLAQYQLYLDKKAKYEADYRQREAKHYEKWLEDRNKAYARYEHEHRHRKPFHYEAFKPLKEKPPKFTGLALGAFANKTSIFDPDMGNGTPMTLPPTVANGTPTQIHIDNSTHVTVQGHVVDHKKFLDELQKHQDKRHRMQGLHTVVTSGGKK